MWLLNNKNLKMHSNDSIPLVWLVSKKVSRYVWTKQKVNFIILYIAETYVNPCQTSVMQFFGYGLRKLFIFVKNSLNVWQCSGNAPILFFKVFFLTSKKFNSGQTKLYLCCQLRAKKYCFGRSVFLFVVVNLSFLFFCFLYWR